MQIEKYIGALTDLASISRCLLLGNFRPQSTCWSLSRLDWSRMEKVNIGLNIFSSFISFLPISHGVDLVQLTTSLIPATLVVLTTPLGMVLEFLLLNCYEPMIIHQTGLPHSQVYQRSETSRQSMEQIYFRSRLSLQSSQTMSENKAVSLLCVNWSTIFMLRSAFLESSPGSFLWRGNIWLWMSHREKKRRRNHFDLCTAVHEAEYKNVKRPINPTTNESIEPAHKFEITLEPDSITDEK